MSLSHSYPPLSTMGSLGPLNFTYVDVGGRGGLGQPWESIEDVISVVGFEPDPEECERLNRKAGPRKRFLSAALSNEVGVVPLHLAHSRGTSSLFPPDLEVLASFPDAQRFATERTIQVACTTIDALTQTGELGAMDFVKLDVQGAELKVLQGGAGTLPGELVGLESEVEFLPIYRGQPLFADVDAWVRTHLGFELMDIRTSYWRRMAEPAMGSAKGQLIFGDALYFKPPADVLAMGRPAKIEAALVMAVAYGYLDYAVRLLTLAERHQALSSARAEAWHRALRAIGRSLRPFGNGSPRLAAVLFSLFRLFQGSTGGWSTIGAPLGSRKRFFWFE